MPCHDVSVDEGFGNKMLLTCHVTKTLGSLSVGSCWIIASSLSAFTITHTDSVVLHLKSQRNGASDDGILIDGGKKLNFLLWELKIFLNIFNYFSNNPSKCRSFFTLINNYSKMGETSG
ncbi:hypothetical protein OUZ56_014817 [Daphnia magna]|uniref:Uncharacterized protein n=1 Tax=Daphnia magna TaxID=35525 RepID=A0ABR0AKX1_9CRUS|nr:hypothetical protein OUZ56_014817 [Daphnia magna]